MALNSVRITEDVSDDEPPALAAEPGKPHQQRQTVSEQAAAPASVALIIPPWYRDYNFLYSIVLGVGVMLFVTAYWTAANIGENLVEGMKKYGFTGNESFISLAIMYSVTFLVTPLVPIMVDILTAKWALVCGASTFVVYVASFLIPSVPLLLSVSVLIGIGYAVQIAGLGTMFTMYSIPATVERNMAFLWGVLNFSLIWGNLFVSLKFQNMDVIDDANRVMAAWVLVGFASSGCLVLATLGRPRAYETVGQKDDELVMSSSTSSASSSSSTTPNNGLVSQAAAAEAPRRRRFRKNYWKFIKAVMRQFWRVCRSSTILLCMCSMLFYGVESTFFSAVFPTAVGFNAQFGNQAKSLAGLCGVLVGVGEITGGLATALVSKYAGRHTTVLIGFVCSALGFIAAVVNVPAHSSIEPTNAPTLLPGSSSALALVTAYLLGAGDACLSTSVYSLISDVFGEYDKRAKAERAVAVKQQQSATPISAASSDVAIIRDEEEEEAIDATTAAFTIMNSVQSLATAVMFAVSTQVELTWLVLVFGVVGAASSISYFEAHRRFVSGRLRFTNES